MDILYSLDNNCSYTKLQSWYGYFFFSGATLDVKHESSQDVYVETDSVGTFTAVAESM